MGIFFSSLRTCSSLKLFFLIEPSNILFVDVSKRDKIIPFSYLCPDLFRARSSEDYINESQ